MASSWLAAVVAYHSLHCAGASNWSYTGEVKVGILHSQTGTMGISEITLINADLMAIDEVNAKGGLLGKKVVPIIKDGKSDWDVFAEEAEKFSNPTSPDYVDAVFGCWTSASRKSVLPVFEKNNHLLFYPVQYEGQECSKNIFYTGATPNQQSEPAVDWLLRYRGTEFFLVGSDYVFPRTSNEITRGQLAVSGGTVVGEEYLTLGDGSNESVGPIIDKILKRLPNGGVIMNTLNGDSNVKFFHMFYDAGLRADTHPIMSLSITETEISVIGIKYLLGHYAAWNFFQAIKDNVPIPGGFDPQPAKEFVQNYRDRFGQDKLVNDPMEAAYISVHLWAQAVSLAGTFELEAVRRTVVGQAFLAAEGEVTMESNHHISKFVRLGEVTSSGDFKMIYESTRPVFPEPWNKFVSTSRGHACDWSDPVNKGSFYKQDTVEVALVHALTGPQAAAEKPHLEAEIAAIKTLNRNGGVLGKTILFQVFDSASDDATALSLMGSVAESDPVVMFGRSPSDALYEQKVGNTRFGGLGPPLLFSPEKSIGGECSEHVIHMGGLLNQQLWPALQYFSNRARAAGKADLTLFVVASAAFSESMLAALQSHIESLGDKVAGKRVLDATMNAGGVAADIKATMPGGGLVLNLIEDADLARGFMLAMRNEKLSAGAFPVLLTGILETDVADFGTLLENQFVSLPYFAALSTPDNTLFLGTIQENYGLKYIVTDQVEASFASVMAWADAVRISKSFASRAVLQALWSAPVETPAGQLLLNGSNYISTIYRLGTLNGRGTGFRIVGEGSGTAPNPFWLYPERSLDECDFQVWMRLQCMEGKGLIDANGALLANRTNADGCAWCPAGRASLELASSSSGEGLSRICVECSVGTAIDQPGSVQCLPCEPGHYADEPGSQTCSMCEQGRYQDEEGKTSCNECASTKTTEVLGAASPGMCICKEGSFLASAGDETCTECPKGMECPRGSVNYGAQGSLIPDAIHPLIKEGFWSSTDDPLSIYKCTDPVMCPGIAPGSCGAHMSGIVCGVCDEKHYRAEDESCQQCSSVEKSTLLFPIIPLIIGPAVCIMLYKYGRDEVDAWGSPANGIMSIGFLTLLYVQMLAAISTCYILKPAFFKSGTDWTSYSFELMSLLRPDCAVFNDFKASFIGKLFLPLYAALVFGLTWLVSKLVYLIWFFPAMDGDIVFNGFMGIFNTFFMGICQQTFSLFQCYEHPNGKRSLRSQADVLCDSDTWNELVAAALVSILLFCLGAVVLFTYIIAVAHLNFSNVRFRRRWKFLFIRFRPSVQWWAVMLLAKGIWVNLATVIFDKGTRQLVWLMVGILGYLVATLVYSPWRNPFCEHLDVIVHMTVVILFAFLPYFAFPEDATEDDDKYAHSYFVISLIPFITIAVFLVVLFKQRLSPTVDLGNYKKVAKSMSEDFIRLRDPAKLESVVAKLNARDLGILQEAHTIIAAEVLAERVMDLPPNGSLSSSLSPRSLTLQRLVAHEITEKKTGMNLDEEPPKNGNGKDAGPKEMYVEQHPLVEELSGFGSAQKVKKSDEWAAMDNEMGMALEQHFCTPRMNAPPYPDLPAGITTPRSPRMAVQSARGVAGTTPRMNAPQQKHTPRTPRASQPHDGQRYAPQAPSCLGSR